MNDPDTAPIIDSHCHLAKFHQRGDLDAVLSRATAQGVTRLITIGTSSADWSLYRDLARAYPHRIAFTAGLHPSDVNEAWETEIENLIPFFETSRKEDRPVALGEIGLDYFRLTSDPGRRETTVRNQKAALAAQLDLAARFETPVVIHSRSAQDDCVSMIEASPVDPARCVFHCFAGDPDEARQLEERGIAVSITGIVTFKSAAKLRESVRVFGPDRLMVETDSPYLAPEPFRGEENEPAHTRIVANFLADQLGIPTVDFAGRTRRRTESFFGLSPG